MARQGTLRNECSPAVHRKHGSSDSLTDPLELEHPDDLRDGTRGFRARVTFANTFIRTHAVDFAVLRQGGGLWLAKAVRDPKSSRKG